MIYIVYFTTKAGGETVSTTVLGMFMMKDDAETFKAQNILGDSLVIKEVNDWEGWTAIRKKANLYGA